MVEGFDQPLVFEFEKAPEYASLEDVEGMVHENGWYIPGFRGGDRGRSDGFGVLLLFAGWFPPVVWKNGGSDTEREVKGDSKEAGEWENN